eukprot:g2672.t1
MKYNKQACLWGAYAYRISRNAAQRFFHKLKQNPHRFLFRGGKKKKATPRPIDKVMPSILLTEEETLVNIAIEPFFFRAPMLESEIHVEYDKRYYATTTLQLELIESSWQNVWLAEEERLLTNECEN